MTESAPYKILFTKSARKDYESVTDLKLKRGIHRVLDNLKENPFQFKKLSGSFANLRSAKTFSFRILYEIKNNELLVIVVSIDHRKDVYR